MLEAPFLCSASIAYTKNGITKIRFTRQWEFLERLSFASDFYPTATTDKDFKHDPNVGTDHEYKIEGYCSFDYSSSGYNLYWRLNGNYTNGYSSVTAKGATATQIAGVSLAYNSTVDTFMSVSSVLTFPGDGYGYCAGSCATRETASLVRGNHITGVTGDLSSGLTSIGLNTNNADISLGSYFDLYRRPQFDKTPLKLWVY